MADITHRMVETNGINMHIAEAGDGPLVLMIHGWPESWYTWHHQLPALAAAGYHAVALDVRGYGRTDAPQPIEAYSMKHMIADYLGVLDALGERTAVIVGTDFGSLMAWHSAALHPDRYRAVVGMSVPYTGRAPMPPTKLLKAAFGDTFFYILYFQEPGVAEAEFEADIPRTMRLILAGVGSFDPASIPVQTKKKGDKFLTGIPFPEKLPDWLSEADIAYFANELARNGFRGPLNRYRNMDRDWEELPELATAKIEQPALFITGELDPVRAMAPPDAMKPMAPGLKDIIVIPGAGHWAPLQRPADVNAALIKFLKGL